MKKDVGADQPERRYGVWWLPDDPERKIPGTYERASDGRQTLRLTGCLGKPRQELRTARINGAVSLGTAMSLDNCTLHLWDEYTQHPRQEWSVGESVLGVELTDESDWNFRSAIFNVPGLTRWTQWNPFTRGFEQVGEDSSARWRVHADKYRRMLWCWDGMTVEAGSNMHLNDVAEDLSELRSRTDLLVRSDNPRSRISLGRAAVSPARLLIGLATGKFTAAIDGSVQCEFPDTKKLSHALVRRWHPLDINLNPLKVTFAFTLKHVDDLAEGSLQRWVEKMMRLEAVVDLYLALLSEMTQFAELRFQMVCQALETYHRETIGGSFVPDDEFKVLKDAMKEALAAAATKSSAKKISGKLGGLNSIPLSARLVALFVSVGALGEAVAGEKVGRFCERVALTRNGLTHWSEQPGDMFERGEGLFLATERLVGLLEVLLIRDLGFSNESKAVAEILARRINWQ